LTRPRRQPTDARAGQLIQMPSEADINTRAFYEEHAEEYALATRDADLGPLWGRFQSSVSRGSLVADLGCGGGRDMRQFTAAGLAPIGLDRSSALCRIARKVSNRPVVIGDVRSLPFDSAVFDGVWVTAVLLHLSSRELNLALGEIRRVLRPHGIALISFKEGAGSIEDEQGRLTYLYKGSVLLTEFTRAGLRVVEAVSTAQRRGRVDVPWIAYLLRRNADERRIVETSGLSR
jgi:SAM-dependent methyltransferase